METFYIPNENDLKRWIREAICEYLTDTLATKLPQNKNQELLISRKETSKRLGISLVTLTVWIKNGLPSHKIRGRVYFDFSEVTTYIKNRNSHQ